MKFAITILFAVSCGCASAMPPLHKPPYVLSCTLPDGAQVTGANFYKAHPADTAWTFEGSASGTNGQTVAVAFDASYELHTADCTNSATGACSDYCPVLTNQIPNSPGNPKVK